MSGQTDLPKSPLASPPMAYARPTLVRGPVLASIAATLQKQISPGAGGDDCWVARAAFGATDIRWMIFRAWLLEDAPAWFRDAYLRHGRSFGAWLTGRDRARVVVRRLMMPAIRRKIRV